MAPAVTPVLTRRTSRHGTLRAVSMMKDEAPFLLEWFAHHLAVGFTDILVYTNDCTDGTVEMLQRLEQLGLGHHRHNVIPPGIKPQPSALNHAQDEPLVAASDWVMVFDADEFLSINHPSGTLDGMLDDAVAKGANGVVVTWRIFGSNGVQDWSRAPVTEQYTRAAPPLWNKGWGVKTLFRFDPEYWRLGIHRPMIRNKHLNDGFPNSVLWLNGSGQPMEEYFKFRGWRSIRRTVGYDWAQMNHYAVKSIDSYAIRKLCGNVNNKKDKYNADYWALQDRNEVPDTRILRHAPERARIMAGLLADPVLRDLHEAAIARVEARLAEMRGTDAYRQLREGLIAAGQVPIAQVEAKPPQARDPAKIAMLMSRVRPDPSGPAPTDAAPPEAAAPDLPPAVFRAGSPYVAGPIDLSADTPVEWVRNQDFELPADERIFSGTALMAVLSGKFDRRNARNIGMQIGPARRLLDVNAGVGLPAMKALRDRADLTVMLHDERPGLARAARAVHARNGLTDPARLRVVSGPLAGKGRPGLPGLDACLHDFQPDVLRVSEAAAVAALFADKTPPARLTRIVLPFESAEEAAQLRQAHAATLARHGFHEDAAAAETGALLYLRRS